MREGVTINPSEARLANAHLGRNLTFGLSEAIGRAVIVGRYTNQAFPTEAELASTYGVSRSVTREAVKILCAKGLLGARASQGTFVQCELGWNLLDPDVLRWHFEERSPADILRQFDELRLAIEPRAAALAARRASPRSLDGVVAALEDIHGAESEQDDPLQGRIAFHAAVLRASGNPFFSRFQTTIVSSLHAYSRHSRRMKYAPVEYAKNYRPVCYAILAGDAARAGQAMETLIRLFMRIDTI